MRLGKFALCRFISHELLQKPVTFVSKLDWLFQLQSIRKLVYAISKFVRFSLNHFLLMKSH
jgi:hypothetical protein